MTANDLRAFLIENEVFDGCDEVGRIQVNKIKEGIPTPRIWLQRSGTTSEVFNAGDDSLKTLTFDLEVCSIDIEEAFDIADTVKELLDGYHGAMGDGWALATFVEDHDDEYLPKSLDNDKGFHICSLSVSIIEG